MWSTIAKRKQVRHVLAPGWGGARLRSGGALLEAKMQVAGDLRLFWAWRGSERAVSSGQPKPVETGTPGPIFTPVAMSLRPRAPTRTVNLV